MKGELPQEIISDRKFKNKLDKIYSLLEKVEIITDEKKGEKVKLYNKDKIIWRIAFLPPYVADGVLNSLTEEIKDQNRLRYSKVLMDKWGRKDPETKRYSETPEMIFYRAALNIADGLVKNDPSLDLEKITKKIFYKFVNREIYPNTPYMANGGHKLIANKLEEVLKDKKVPLEIINDLKEEKKIKEQLFACFVLPVYDSRESIFGTLKEAANIQASIGGTGFNFELRQANETVEGTGGITDGPVSFMKMFSEVLGKTMNQGGKREGANMFLLDWNHPDIMRFIYSKRIDGEVSSANISVAIDHEFMKAVKSKGEGRFYKLKNIHYNPKLRPHVSEYYTIDQLKSSIEISKINKKLANISLILDKTEKKVLSPWLPEGMDEEDRVIGKVGEDGYIYLDAKKVLKHIAYGAWFNGEPGVIFIGHINDKNPTHPNNYEEYLKEQNDDEAKITVEKIKKRVENSQNTKSLEEMIHEYVWEKGDDGRLINLPIGVGVIKATNPCGEKPLLPYESCVLGHINLEKILKKDEKTESGYSIDMEKFKENIRIMYEILDNAIDQNEFTNPIIEKTQKSNRKIGLGFMGLANMLYKLELSYNSEEGRKFVDELLDFWEKESDEVSFEKAEKKGPFPNFKYSRHRKGRPKRNAIVRTIAPTGTTGFVAQTTSGMEPEYALVYTRTTAQGTMVNLSNPILEEKLKKYPFFLGDDSKERFYEFIINEGKGSLQGFSISRQEGESDDSFKVRKKNLEKIKKIFVTAYDISPEDHLKMEAIVQKHVDDAISKTTNFRNNASVEDIKKALILAYDLGIKGVTFYRDGTRKNQPLTIKGGETEKINNLEEKVSTNNNFIVDLTEKERPEIVCGITTKIKTPYESMFITLNKAFYENKWYYYECFIEIGKAGSDIKAMAEGYGRLISYLLKKGVSPERVQEQLSGIKGETRMGIGPNSINSFPHAIAMALEKICEIEKKLKVEVVENQEDVIDVVEFKNKRENNQEIERENAVKTKTNNKLSGNLCPNCHAPLIIQEGCEKCSNCNFSRC
ncbi:MAG: hypothetical protein QXU40_00255 [Candidatus Pacearchaeota archaeon]